MASLAVMYMAKKMQNVNSVNAAALSGQHGGEGKGYRYVVVHDNTKGELGDVMRVRVPV